MKERPLQQFQILVLKYFTIYKELTGREYTDVSRDWKDAKDFMQWKDWNSEVIELKLKEQMPQYLQDKWWAEQNFPAYGLFTQWNKFNPKHTKMLDKPKRVIPKLSEQDWWCEDCRAKHRADEMCHKTINS